MKIEDIEEILRAHSSGSVSTDSAAEQIKNLSFEDIGFARVDHSRPDRQGFPEVIFGAGKTRQQVVAIFEKLVQRSPNVLVTRTDADTYGELRNVCTDAEWHVWQIPTYGRTDLQNTRSGRRKTGLRQA